MAEVVAAAGKVLRAYGLDELADLATRKNDPDRQHRTVVVVGEVNRGKSSLVNALVGRRNLCPVGVDTTSSVTVSVVPDVDGEDGTATLLTPGGARRIPVAELDRWVTVDGAGVRDPDAESLPTAAVVPLAGHALGDVSVIDTPGVGGLEPGLAALATQTSAQACVLVLVCDASSPLTAPEMAFAREAAASVDALVVAVTKTDKNLRRWRPIVAENERLLREHLQRAVPVIGVSSLRGVLAADDPDPARRAHLEQVSGIGLLRSEIHHRLAAASALPAADALRTALEGLRTVATRVDGELAAVDDAADRLPGLTAERDRLTELEEHSRQWEQYLARDITLVRQQSADDLDRRLDEIRDKWTTYVNSHGMQVLRRSPQKFVADMQADLQAAMAETLAGFLQRLHAEVYQPRLGDDPVLWEDLCGRIVDSMRDRTIESHQVASRRQGLIDPALLTMGVVGSSTLGGLIGLSAVVGIGAVVGTVWVGVNLGHRAIRSGKANLLTWLRETIGTTKVTVGRLLDGAVAQARPEIVIGYRSHLRRTLEDLRRTISTAEQAASSDEASRTKTRERLQNNRRIVGKRITELEELLAQSPVGAVTR
ncbi:dynamin family protein [Rhodococcus sp. NPDC058505]|uniref:dynamin family protein n=1 Tax=Rhodococcus sp. NPDC058505 TaxID=3346531 RepID=UPI003652E5DC